MITRKGTALFQKMQRAGMIDWSESFDYDRMLDDLSKMCRHGSAYDTIQARWCNEEMSTDLANMVRKRESLIEDRIVRLAEYLPFGPWAVQFEGDPRGPVVVLRHRVADREFVVA